MPCRQEARWPQSGRPPPAPGTGGRTGGKRAFADVTTWRVLRWEVGLGSGAQRAARCVPSTGSGSRGSCVLGVGPHGASHRETGSRLQPQKAASPEQEQAGRTLPRGLRLLPPERWGHRFCGPQGPARGHSLWWSQETGTRRVLQNTTHGAVCQFLALWDRPPQTYCLENTPSAAPPSPHGPLHSATCLGPSPRPRPPIC